MSAIMNNPTAALGFRFLKIGEPGDGPKVGENVWQSGWIISDGERRTVRRSGWFDPKLK